MQAPGSGRQGDQRRVEEQAVVGDGLPDEPNAAGSLLSTDLQDRRLRRRLPTRRARVLRVQPLDLRRRRQRLRRQQDHLGKVVR